MIEIYTDGASRGNPGNSASSFLFVKSNKVLFFSSEYIGEKTNNIAEYTAIINALKSAVKKRAKEIILTSDSELVISQITGSYKVKAEHLKKLHNEVIILSKKFKQIEFKHARRENKYIKIADKLCNMILDMR